MSFPHTSSRPEATPGPARVAIAIQEACDRYAGRLYYPALCLILLLIAVFTRWYGRKLAADWEQWVIADWLISYAPGFVRRGLSGEALLALSAFSGVPANTVVLWTIVGLFVAFAVLFVLLLAGRRMTFWYFFLCLSPGVVPFTFYNEAAVGRKEWLIFTAFAAWALTHAWRRRMSWFEYVAYAVLCFALTLMHEATFFFTPYFVLLSWLESSLGREHTDWRRSLLLPGASALALLVIVVFSGSLNDPALCDRLIRAGAPNAACSGVLEFRDMPFLEALTKAGHEFGTSTLNSLLLAAALVVVPVLPFLLSNSRERKPSTWLVAGAALGLFAFTLPLFVLAVDWGRWVAIHTMLLTLTCSVLLERRNAPPRTRQQHDWRVTVPALLGGIALLSTVFLWTPRYCCGAELVTPLGPVKAISGMVEEIRANLKD